MSEGVPADWTSEHRPRVVIVDDDPEMRALLRDVLHRAGFAVREHPTGDGLLPLLQSWMPDAVVLDNVMDRTTGLAVLPEIRQRHPSVPVVLVTAFGGADVESTALRLGATYYMDKPFRVGRLLAVLRTALGEAAQGAGCRRVDCG